MKIMSFNLRVDVESDGTNAWNYRNGRVVKILKNHSPCIVGTQEGIDYMINDLLNELPDYENIGKGRDSDCTGETTAILFKKSKLKCIENGQFWLSETPEIPGSVSWESAFPRTCTWGKFQSLEDTSIEFLMVNTHLDHISQEARENGMRLITDFIHTNVGSTDTVFLTGDFNVTPENEVIQYLDNFDILQNSQKFADGEIGITFHDFDGGSIGEPIDYIYTSKSANIEKLTVDRTKFDDGFPSDHYPLVISVRTK